jgi:hypothetical protein
METLRAYASNNRGSIINVIYVVAVLVGVYYLYKWLVSGSDMELVVLNKEVDGNVAQSFPLSNNYRLRVRRGGEYTLSFWMYIRNWDDGGNKRGVLRIMEAGDSSPLLATFLYPASPMMGIRIRQNQNQNSAIIYETTADNAASAPMCDLADISLQRWINVTISVNGRIVDIYYDGKLARSCVLPNLPYASETKAQSIEIGYAVDASATNGFFGKLGGIQFFGYPLTPDRIYSIYQAGPAGPSGLLGFLQEKLGINILYQAPAATPTA